MATLPEEDRLKIWRGLMRYWSRLQEVLPDISKAELKAAIDATDQWVDSNAAGYNTALPNPFRSNATQSQKSLLLVGVVAARFNPELLKIIFGEVD